MTQNSSDNLPSYFQTSITAQMLSIGEEGTALLLIAAYSQLPDRGQKLIVASPTLDDGNEPLAIGSVPKKLLECSSN